MGRGRPFPNRRAVMDAILERLSAGESLQSICRDEGMPSEYSVRAWAIDDVDGFSTQYARARELQYEYHAERLIELADAERLSKRRVVRADGSVEETELDHVDRSRLQIDTRKWLLSKLLPKKYGDKTTVDVNAQVSGSATYLAVIPAADAKPGGG